MLAICKYCGTEYRTHPSWQRSAGGGGFCSRQCAGKAKTARQTLPVTCRTCGATFTAILAKVAAGYVGYCNRRCRDAARSQHYRAQPPTQRQQHALELWASGMTYCAIARELGITLQGAYKLVARAHRHPAPPFLPADTDTSACRATEQTEGR